MMYHIQDSGPFLKGQGHTQRLKFMDRLTNWGHN